MKTLCPECNQERLEDFACFSCGAPPDKQFRVLEHKGYEEGWIAFLPDPEKGSRLIYVGWED